MYDLEDNPLANGSVSVESGNVTNLQIKIDCRAGYILRCKTADDFVGVFGKHAGGGDYVDLETGALDLSSWNGSRETFDIRITGESVSARTLQTIILSVESA